MEVPGRCSPPAGADERENLVGWLDWQRATVVAKCGDLADVDARRSLIATSPRLTISGIVAHLTRVEHDWLVHSFAGGSALDGEDWRPPSASITDLINAYLDQCDFSRHIAADHDLETVEQLAPAGAPLVSLRWILGHLVEETARHVGHLDLLRELTDGARGY